MSEVWTILAEATDRSLVLVDEICRGTDVEKGSFIAASVVEALDHICCIGILSTHLHNLLDMELQTSNVVLKAMGTKEVNGQVEPTWKLGDGACRESLAFDVARKEGVPEPVVQRAEELCMARRRAIWSMASGLDDATLQLLILTRLLTPFFEVLGMFSDCSLRVTKWHIVWRDSFSNKPLVGSICLSRTIFLLRKKFSL